MDESWLAAYPEFERRHFWWRVRRDLVSAIVEERAGGRALRVLDIGCGAGVALEHLASRHAVRGVEASPIAIANSRIGNRIQHATVETAELEAGEFDVVLMMDVLEHLDDPVLGLRRAAGWAGEGGVLIASVPAHRWMWTSHDDINEHRARYDRRSLSELLVTGGWEPTLVRYLFAPLVAPKLVQVALERTGIRPEAGQPSMPSPIVNRLAYRVLRAETALALGPFGRWWNGTSVFAVATRAG